ncbi:hypothetical protein RND71_023442 [Anisodus tanguticus]|uniref:Uncharacterized protein n=1 Tax=Anisodus tanguticus TaxID=243964 RepID=A0AAE1V6Z1_9SOLA|nr:hypothetical protein RND71_023442 [Anisodus tanguticus]
MQSQGNDRPSLCCLELIKYLLKKGANVKTKNKAGKTSIDLASNEEVRSILLQPEIALSKAAVNDGENKVEAEPKIESSDGKGAATEEGEIEAEKDESLKRKGNGDKTNANSKETKKAKVALNHLLASDDNQEDEENL